jgi:ABC-2 type transport system ATP-binding protein
VADRVAIIDHGKLLVLDTPQGLKSRVGEGDVIEISIETREPSQIKQVKAILMNLAQNIHLGADPEQPQDKGKGIISLRALNAVSILPTILDKLQTNGIQPTDVRIRENTLEDVFIQLTGRRLRE